MSGGYDLHPEAFTEIDEIAIYIGQDSREAAHRIVDEIHRHPKFGSVSSPWPPPSRSYEPSLAIHSRQGLPGRLRAG
jgi:hypothetical protein